MRLKQHWDTTFHLSDWAKIHKSDNITFDEAVGKQAVSDFADRSVKWHSCQEDGLAVLNQL